MKLYKDEYPHNWFDDYPTEPIGGGNPYHRCSHCKISVPQINYSLEGHSSDCQYRIQKNADLMAKLSPADMKKLGIKVIKPKGK